MYSKLIAFKKNIDPDVKNELRFKAQFVAIIDVEN